ncbi:MAG: hypothetical protein N3A72_04830 [bacterium]|nr:hypothetical protein [bacterium]
MEINFLKRCLLTTAWVTIIVALFTAYYYNFLFGLGLMIGSAWNIGNFWLIMRLGSALLIKESNDRKRIGYLLALKFPAWYGIGYLILRYAQLPIYGLLVGFSILFIVTLLKALGLQITKSNGKTEELNN